MDKQWLISQNYLTVDLLTLFFHIRNIPTFVLFFIFYLFADFFISFVPAISYFFLMSSFFPPTITEKEKTIYFYIIRFLDKVFNKISQVFEKYYFKFMNF